MLQKSSRDLSNPWKIISQFLLKSPTHLIPTKKDWFLRKEKQIYPWDREIQIAWGCGRRPPRHNRLWRGISRQRNWACDRPAHDQPALRTPLGGGQSGKGSNILMRTLGELMGNMVILSVKDNPGDIDLTLHATVYAGWC